MSSKVQLETIKQNIEKAEDAVRELKNELTTLNTQYNTLLAQQLREENNQLKLAVEEAKNNLIQLEIKNGIQQVLVPQQQSNAVLLDNVTVVEHIKVPDESVTEKKEKKAKAKDAIEKSTPTIEAPVDVGRLDFRIGKIEEVKMHPDADTLYVLKINCGETNPRTVCSGLVNYIPIEALEHKYVVVLCNLKPVKMRGITSEAMLMCAFLPDELEVLLPPNTSVPGDLVHCDGFTRNPDRIMNPKKKIFETVAPDLCTNDLFEACYKGIPLKVPGKGSISVVTLRNCPIK